MSNYIFICEIWLFDLFYLNSANLICRDTDISNYFRESLGLRDKESQLRIFSYFYTKTFTLGTHYKRLIEAFVNSTNNICCHAEIGKYQYFFFVNKVPQLQL